jgi:signal transduction histidine kinase
MKPGKKAAGKTGSRISPAARVAAVATAVIAVAYLGCVIVLNVVVSGHLTDQNDERLAARLTTAPHDPAAIRQPVARAGSSPGADNDDIDGDSAPVFLWSLTATGAIAAHSPGAPALPTGVLPAGTSSAGTSSAGARPGGVLRDEFAQTVTLGSAGAFRLKLAQAGQGWLMAGQSLVGQAHTQRLLLTGELIAGPFVLLAMFGGSLVVGLRALAPVEQSRRRQLEFTADASHELRTPISVIRAEADVALSSPREAAEYRDALTRIHGESQRLRQLVEDMLWLARFDSEPPPPGDEPVDLATLAQACADRFRSVGPAIGTDITTGPALISAPPEWIDRLAGVLVDNACRYAGADGQVRIGVAAQGSRISLVVEDSGPGIDEAERPRLFDRFHRATERGAGVGTGTVAGVGAGAGLGLAIGDSIVRSTGGRWHVGDSPLGGALMSVSWRHS